MNLPRLLPPQRRLWRFALDSGNPHLTQEHMKTIFHPAHRRDNGAVITLLSSCLITLTAYASTPTPTATATATPTPACTATPTLPPPPKGVSVLNSNNRALRTGILSNCNVDMISLGPDWNSLEPTEGIYDWTDIDCPLNTINSYGKAVLLRIETMGGCPPTGNTPCWVFAAMGQPACTTVTPGVTYGFVDSNQIVRVIPVFWNEAYLAKKKALIAMAGAHITENPQFNSQVRVFVISYANAITEDWNIPHDTTTTPFSQVELWLNTTTACPPGAGYTTQQMIDAAIHQADSPIFGGVISNGGLTLSSVSAVFTQADVGHTVTGHGYHSGTVICDWISPTQVTLNQRASRHASSFKILARRDGLIDVAMAAFPNQYIATAENSNGPDLDCAYCSDPGICLAETVNQMVWSVYGNRYIVQRNNVTAVIPTKCEATDAWQILADAADAGMPTAGQALSNCCGDMTYQMNGGNNCNLEDPNCTPGPSGTPTPTPTPTPTACIGDCAITFQQELDQSGDHLRTYNANYYEVYYLDAAVGHLSLDYLHGVFTGTSCTPGPTPTATPPTCSTPTATPTPIQACSTPTATPTPTPTPQC
jgi:hypothetical protein